MRSCVIRPSCNACPISHETSSSDKYLTYLSSVRAVPILPCPYLRNQTSKEDVRPKCRELWNDLWKVPCLSSIIRYPIEWPRCGHTRLIMGKCCFRKSWRAQRRGSGSCGLHQSTKSRIMRDPSKISLNIFCHEDKLKVIWHDIRWPLLKRSALALNCPDTKHKPVYPLSESEFPVSP